MGAAIEALADLPAPLSDRQGPLDRALELEERADDLERFRGNGLRPDLTVRIDHADVARHHVATTGQA